MGVTCALNAVQPVGRTTTRTRHALGQGTLIISGWGMAYTEGMFQGLRSQIKVWAVTAQVCAGGDARVCVLLGGTVRAHARGWLPNALQSCRYVYPVELTDRCFSFAVDVQTRPYYTWAGRTHEWPFPTAYSLFFCRVYPTMECSV